VIVLTYINDENVKLYLSRNITIDELKKRMIGVEPYEVIGDDVVVLSDEDYMKKIGGGKPCKNCKEKADKKPSETLLKDIDADIAKLRYHINRVEVFSTTDAKQDTVMLFPVYGSHNKFRHRAILKSLNEIVNRQHYIPDILILDASKKPLYPELMNLDWVRYIHFKTDATHVGLFQKEALLEAGRKLTKHKNVIWADADVWSEDSYWIDKIRAELLKDSFNLVQGFTKFIDPIASKTDAVGFVCHGQDASALGWIAPGLIWGATRTYIDKCPSPFWNPYCIAGSGDVMFVHEHIDSEEFPAYLDWHWYRDIMRSDIQHGNAVCVDSDVIHEYHGMYQSRAYHWSRRVLDAFGVVTQFVHIDDAGLLAWHDPDNPVRDVLLRKSELRTLDDVDKVLGEVMHHRVRMEH